MRASTPGKSNNVQKTLGYLSQWLRLPAVCALCKHYHNHASSVCKRCSALLVRIEHACCICALPLPTPTPHPCGHCIKQKPIFDRVITNLCYQEPLRSLLHEFKFENGLYLRRFLAELMLDAWDNASIQPDCLVPVPMHKQRLRQRGFNQAMELAKILSRKRGLKLATGLCQKRHNTSPQSGLDRSQRQRNLAHAFVAHAHDYQHIVLVDDLLTTGSTANELARVLKLQGVARVDVWCLARTAAPE